MIVTGLRFLSLAGALLMATACMVAAGPAEAADASFTGTWSADLSKCKTPQDDGEAPMIVTKSGYDQHEAHCTFKTVKETGKGEWKVTGSCSVEGDEQPLDDMFTVSGNTLSIGGGGSSQDLLRCP
jgi:hypothetical protein